MPKMWEPVSDGRALLANWEQEEPLCFDGSIQILNSKTPFNNQLTRTVF